MQNPNAKNIAGHEVAFEPEDFLIHVRLIGRVTYAKLREFAEAFYG